MAVKTNQTWTLYKTNGGQDESNMNSLQNKWQSRRIKQSSCLIPLDCHLFCRVHVWFVLTVICFVESSCLIRLAHHLFCREFMFHSSWQPFVLNSLQQKWQSRRIKHELSTTQMAVKTNQTWTLYKTNGSQEESNMNSLQNTSCCVESSCLIPLDCHLFCREFMFDSSWLPFVL
jgi:hypothetical protein